MKVWKWYCHTHDLGLLAMQTGSNPPAECSGLADITYPGYPPCRFSGESVLAVYMTASISGLGSAALPSHSLPQPETSGKAGTLATPRVPATRHTT